MVRWLGQWLLSARRAKRTKTVAADRSYTRKRRMMQAFFLCRRAKYEQVIYNLLLPRCDSKNLVFASHFGNDLSTHKNNLCTSHLRKAFLARLVASRRRPVARGGATRSATGSDGRRPGLRPKPLGGASRTAGRGSGVALRRCGAAAPVHDKRLELGE